MHYHVSLFITYSDSTESSGDYPYFLWEIDTGTFKNSIPFRVWNDIPECRPKKEHFDLSTSVRITYTLHIYRVFTFAIWIFKWILNFLLQFFSSRNNFCFRVFSLSLRFFFSISLFFKLINWSWTTDLRTDACVQCKLFECILGTAFTFNKSPWPNLFESLRLMHLAQCLSI